MGRATSRRFTLVKPLFVLVIIATLFGCSSNEHPELRPVSGTVTYNGEPLDDAIVAFYNENSSRLASGHTDSEGRFFLTSYEQNDGAIPGDHTVMVTKAEMIDEEETPALSTDEALDAEPQEKSAVRLLVPEKYTLVETTPLVISVSEDGPNEVTIKLED